MATNVDPDGPLNLPPLPGTEEAFGPLPSGMNDAAVAARRLQLRQRKAAAGAHMHLGAALSARWLPADTGWVELDQVREEHLAARSRVAVALDKLNGLDAKFAAEDEARKAAYTEAAQYGYDEPPKFERTPQADRQQQRQDAEEALWSKVAVLHQVVERVKATLQTHEAPWLADLHRISEDDEEERELARRLEEVRRKRFRATALAQWLKNENGGGGPGGAFGPQPAPTGDEPVPAIFNEPQAGQFERRYFEQERRAPVKADPVVVDDPLGVADLGDDEEFRTWSRRARSRSVSEAGDERRRPPCVRPDSRAGSRPRRG
jgi:hypothetical protein